jgi:hypothetical protein
MTMSDLSNSMTELAEFVAEAIDYGWPDNTVLRSGDEFTGFWNTHYTREAWSYVDLWSGSSTDAGVQIVFHSDQPRWCCLYRGGLLRKDLMEDLSISGNRVFAFLVEALRSSRVPDLPIRGPREYRRGSLCYRLRYTGDLCSFVAFETIVDNLELVYERTLIGGQFGDGVAYGTALGHILP